MEISRSLRSRTRSRSSAHTQRPGGSRPRLSSAYRSRLLLEAVFISSAIKGLERVRLTAREAVESVGMLPIMAERLGASPDSPQQALLREVGEADIYLLILGAEYWPSHAESGLSPTEEEFEEAERLRQAHYHFASER